MGYAGFPVINKDNYALGTFCLTNKKPAALTDEQIQLMKGISQRIAYQIDIQTNQRETTLDAVQSALRTFTSISPDNNLSLFNNFLSVCSGMSLPTDEMKSLDEMGLTENSELSTKGKEILKQMKLQPKVMKRKIVSSKDKPQFLDDLLGEL
jgi:ERCC4-type nuclease